MKTYRVMASHCEDPSELDGEFQASSDEAALKIFNEKYVYNRHYGMDYVQLYRVDVVEKKTFLKGYDGGQQKSKIK